MTDSFSDYRKLSGTNWSTLKAMNTSPLHYLHALTTERPDTAAMALGRAVHAAVLEPDEFPLRYTVWHEAKRGNEYKAFATAAESNGLEVLNPDEYAKCLAMRDACEQHPVAGQLLCGGEAEVTIQWVDPDTKLECKGRCDYVKDGLLIDLKTTRSLDEHDFQGTFSHFDYEGQLAMYLDGLRATRGGTWEACIVAVESDAPYDVAVWLPSEDSLDFGDELYHELLARVAYCTDTGDWPGRYPDPVTIDLPGWRYPSIDEIADRVTITRSAS